MNLDSKFWNIALQCVGIGIKRGHAGSPSNALSAQIMDPSLLHGAIAFLDLHLGEAISWVDGIAADFTDPGSSSFHSSPGECQELPCDQHRCLATCSIAK